jgi:hypothetical protein
MGASGVVTVEPPGVQGAQHAPSVMESTRLKPDLHVHLQVESRLESQSALDGSMDGMHCVQILSEVFVHGDMYSVGPQFL